MIYWIVGRLSGLNSSIFPIRSRQSSLAWGITYLRLTFFERLIILNTSWPEVNWRLSTYASEGGPFHITTFYNWFIVEVPGKSGFPFCISPKRQPMLQISMARVYLLDPNRIYGARYHLVAIYSVSISLPMTPLWSWSSSDLTSPKSHSLASQF